jgi:dTDP-4-dehydrorhamnose 3,5-epimerase
MDGVTVTKLNQISHSKGDIYHAMKASDVGFHGFGEAYFSTINQGDIKGWKKHNKMFLNLVVVVGEVEFVVYNELEFLKITLSKNNYQRLTVSPGLWFAFKGLSKNNTLLNLASIEHDSSEVVNAGFNEIKYSW